MKITYTSVSEGTKFTLTTFGGPGSGRYPKGSGKNPRSGRPRPKSPVRASYTAILSEKFAADLSLAPSAQPHLMIEEDGIRFTEERARIHQDYTDRCLEGVTPP